MTKKRYLNCGIFILCVLPCFCFGQDTITGKYSDTTCFRISECCITNLVLKNDYSYVLTYIGINHRKRNKTFEKGNWTINGNVLKLNPKEGVRRKLDESTPRDFLYYADKLWYVNDSTAKPEGVAFKKINK